MLERFCENFLLKLRAAQAVYSERILSGSFKTLEEYKYVAGRLRGLMDTEIVVKGLYKDMVERVDISTIMDKHYVKDDT